MSNDAQPVALPSVSLYFTEGSSDKAYQAQIKAKDGGYVVDFQYGPRGKALKAGTKTAEPVSLAAATKIYDKLVAEKTGKGYTQDQSGTVYQSTENAGRVTGIRPQLLNPVPEESLEHYFTSPKWFAQMKYDGERRPAAKDLHETIGINRNGLKVPLPMPIADAIAAAPFDQFVMDGEIIGDVLYVFDLVELNGADLRVKPAAARLEIMSKVFDSIGESASLTQVKTAYTEAEKRALFAWVKQNNLEGVVFKHVDSKYVPGRPSTGGEQVKFKFVESATVEVLAPNSGKRSVSLCGYDADGQQVSLGNVTIPANQDIPKSGDVVEVEYLYAYEGGSLFQPVYKGVRGDQDRAACTLSQLKYSVEHADAEFEASSQAAPARPKG